MIYKSAVLSFTTLEKSAGWGFYMYMVVNSTPKESAVWHF